MDIHPPEEPIRSVKDFLYHMLTIVLGILIALSLEGLVEWNHHRSLVRETRESLAREIGENQTRLKKGLALAPQVEGHLRSAIELAEERQTARQTPDTTPDLSFGTFPLSATNWNTAQSSGALAFMDPDDVQHYTRIYAVQQNFLALQDQTLLQWLALQKWQEYESAFKGLKGLNVQEVETFKQEAASALVYLQTEESFAKTLIDEYSKAPAK
jgi:hypothetical protein